MSRYLDLSTTPFTHYATSSALPATAPNGTLVIVDGPTASLYIYDATSTQWLIFEQGVDVPVAIGDLIAGGTNKSVLYLTTAGHLDQDNANFNYDKATHILSVPKVALTAGNAIGAPGTTTQHAIATFADATGTALENSPITIDLVNGGLLVSANTGYIGTPSDQVTFESGHRITFYLQGAGGVAQVTTAGLQTGPTLPFIFRGTNHSVAVSANPASDYALVWPTAQGSLGDTLINDGAGQLSWGAAAGGTLTIGDAVGSSSVNGILFIDAANKLADDVAHFSYNSGTHALGLGGDLIALTDGVGRIGNLGASRPLGINASSYANIGNAPQNSDQSEGFYDGFIQVGNSPAGGHPSTTVFAGSLSTVEVPAQMGFAHEETGTGDMSFAFFEYLHPDDPNYIQNGDVAWNTNSGNAIYLRGDGSTDFMQEVRFNATTNFLYTLTLTDGVGIEMFGATSGSMSLQVPAVVTPYGLIFPATLGATNTFIRHSGSGNLVFSEPAATLNFPSTRMGEATLVAGSVSVVETSVTAKTRVFLSRQTVGGTPGFESYAVTAGVGFAITSDITDTSTFSYALVEGP